MRALFFRLRDLLIEFKRRNVFKVAVAYLVTAWAVFEVANGLLPRLPVDESVITIIIVLLAAGFPVALILGWAFELTPQGIYLAGDEPDPQLRPSSRALIEVEAVRAIGGEGPRGLIASGDAEEEKGEEAVGAALNNLPPSPNPFVGRTAELERMGALLAAPTCRLLTITGPGGAGKSRLGLELARAQAASFPDGVCFVPLSGVSSSAFLYSTIADRLGVRSTRLEDPRGLLLARVQHRRILLLLDNFEHLMDGGVLLAELLESAPELRVVVTSRERLNLQAETVFPIDGLQVPEEGGTLELTSEAAQLFVQTAARLDPSFAPDAEEAEEVLRICRETDGFPLAIELAAGWIGTLSCREIAEEIVRNRDFLSASTRDFPERHRSLRAVFESSWRLLPEAERAAFRRLSVFRGGFSREAAERVGSASLPLLSSLLNKSLIRRPYGGVYEVHEILRAYAGERLQADAADLEGTRRMHAEHYAEVLAQLESQDAESIDEDAPDRVGPELANFREAWSWSLEAGRLDLVGRMCGGLFAFYNSHNRALEGESLFREAAEALRGATGPEAEMLVARVRSRLAAFQVGLGEYDSARALLDASLAHFRATGSREEAMFALHRLGRLASNRGEYDQAREYLMESLRISHTVGSARTAAKCSSLLGNIAWAFGDYEEANRLWSSSLAVFRELDDSRGISACLKNVAGIAMLQERYADALAMLQESLVLDRALDNRVGMANGLQNVGYVKYCMGDYAGAEQSLREGAAISRETSSPRLEALCVGALGNVYLAQDRLPEAEAHFRRALAIMSELGEAPAVLDLLVKVAELAERLQDRMQALAIAGVVVGHPASDKQARSTAQALISRLGGAAAPPSLPAGAPFTLDRVVERILEAPPEPRAAG